MKQAREDYLKETIRVKHGFKYLHYLDPEDYPPVSKERWLYHKFNHMY